MNLKPQTIVRLGALILVLVALVLISHSTLASHPASHPLSNPIQNCISNSNLALAGLCPVRAGIFTKSTSNPVLTSGVIGSWNEYGVISPSVIYNSTYRMWYTGTNNSFVSSIGYASSADGVSWTPNASNPIFTKDPGGTWESSGVAFPSVFLDVAVYKMWYTGMEGGTRKIGYATSSDGITWTKYAGNPVLVGSAGTWDSSQVTYPAMVKIGGSYHLWYSSAFSPSGGIGFATSPDGITWTKDSANPVIAGGSGGWDDIVIAPAVAYDGCIFHMWYTGCDSSGNCQIGYARSPDGTTWNKSGIAIPLGTTGAFDSGLSGYPSAMIGIPYIRLWYTGSGADEIFRIGFARANRLDRRILLPIIVK